jgi:hypothetical protein
MKKWNMGFLGFLGLLGVLGSITNNHALYGFFGLFGFFGFWGNQKRNLKNDKLGPRKLKLVALLGILLICLGIAFIGTGRLGIAIMLIGVLVVIYSFTE